MKPFLGIDLTLNKENKQFNGNEFLVRKPSSALSKSLEVSTDKAEKIIDKSKLPLPLRIVQFICGIAALFIASGILEADVSLVEGYHNAPGLFWATDICAVIWLILWLCSKKKAKAILDTDESSQTFSHLDSVTNTIYAELTVPDQTKSIDILSFFYKIKKGKIKVQEKGTQLFQYFNPEFKIFTDEENLYLANLEGKYAFPLSAIVKIHTVKKHIRIAGWNKAEKFNQGMYKQYKLTTDNFGCIHCKQYHILEINHQGESYGIYFPSYELPTLEVYMK
ncbi:MAG: hypothetical protein J6K62_00335 [Clostridia bacterium]|nr:hypothetical protein [Clostridia bacterium]